MPFLNLLADKGRLLVSAALLLGAPILTGQTNLTTLVARGVAADPFFNPAWEAGSASESSIWDAVSSSTLSGYPGFPGTSDWPAAIPPNSGSTGANLVKVSNGVGGGPYPSGSSIYYGGFDADLNLEGGTLAVVADAPLAGVKTVTFQIQIGEAWGDDLYNDVLPVLSYTTASGTVSAIAANYTSLFKRIYNGTTEVPAGPNGEAEEVELFINLYGLQWDVSQVAETITELSVSFVGIQHATLQGVRLDQSTEVASGSVLPDEYSPFEVTLLEEYDLLSGITAKTDGTQWTSLSNANAAFQSDNPWEMSGVFYVGSPGYPAGVGLYSYVGDYEVQVLQNSEGEGDFDIEQAVFQMDLLWDPATSFPHNGGPKLSYNGGSQMLEPYSMSIGRTREAENETDVAEMEHLDSFLYRGVTWQWDLTGIEADITEVIITAPVSNHTSVVGTRIDVARPFKDVGGNVWTTQEIWRDTYFGTIENEGEAADLADPDGDGLTNLLEYGLGTRPDSAEGEQGRQSSPSLVMSGSEVGLSFSLPVNPADGIEYVVEACTDFSDWNAIATKTGGGDWVLEGSATASLIGGVERDQFTITDAGGAEPRGFMRLSVSHSTAE